MLPSYASTLKQYSLAEENYVKRAFEPANHISLRALPDKIAVSNISTAMERKIEDNRLSLTRPPVKLTGNKLFSEFRYVPSRYSLAEELEARERLEAEAKRLEVGGRDFVTGGERRKAKYEDGFDDSLKYPYMSNPLEDAKRAAAQEKRLANSKILHGPFRAGGLADGLTSATTRVLLPDMVREIAKILKQDWGEAEFEVLVTSDDAVAVSLLHSYVLSFVLFSSFLSSIYSLSSQQLE